MGTVVEGRKLPRTVVALGFVSFFNDLASEIVIPLVPILLASVLGAGPVVLGLVEGVADALAAFLRLWSGRRSDLLGGRRKGLALAGYGLSNLARPLLGLAASWGAVLVLRSIDRIGKGLRSAPRDALVADATPPEIRGAAFGFQRALDNAGAVGGSLLAAAVLAGSDLGLPAMILFSAVPGAAAVLVLALFVREPVRTPGAAASAAPAPRLALAAVPPPMRRYLGVLGLFTLARASETFILMLGHERGVSTVALLLLWAGLSLAKASAAGLGGRIADRRGRGVVILVSWTAFALSFACFGLLESQLALWCVSIAYGLSIGFGEGAERAVVSDHAGPGDRGSAFGWYNFVLGLAAIPGGLGFGALWHAFGAMVAFTSAAALGLVAVLLFVTLAWPSPREGRA